jgi:RTX calcium-binding nonapeptide repeat (4 copies)
VRTRIFVSGGAQVDTLRFLDPFGDPGIWALGGPGTGTLNQTIRFSAVENLVGGDQPDTFRFTRAASRVDGMLDGAGGQDELNYETYGTATTVNLTAGTASGVGQGVLGIEHVVGSGRRDLLIGDDRDNVLDGGNGPDVLVGFGGNDLLVGGPGRNVLVGGPGADYLVGGGADDLLVAGSTAFDEDEAALRAVQAEWISGRSYLTRVANLRGHGSGPRLNQNYFLVGSGPGQTVFDDAAVDWVTGTAGRDWFFINLDGGVLDILIGRTDNESVDDID